MSGAKASWSEARSVAMGSSFRNRRDGPLYNRIWLYIPRTRLGEVNKTDGRAEVSQTEDG